MSKLYTTAGADYQIIVIKCFKGSAGSNWFEMSLKVDGVDVSIARQNDKFCMLDNLFKGPQQQRPGVQGLGDPIPEEGQGEVWQAWGYDHLLWEDLHQGVWQHELEGQ